MFPARLLPLALALALVPTTLAAGEACFPAWQPIWPPGTEQPDAGRAFARDSRGFTWVGGNLGLYRLDGQSVTAWYPDPDDAAALPGSHVEAVWIDENDAVWVGTAGGLGRMNPTTGAFEQISLRDGDSVEPEIFSLLPHGEQLLIGTSLGLAAINRNDARIVREPTPGRRPARIYGMAAIGGRVFAASTNGLLILDPADNYAPDASATENAPELFADAFLDVAVGPDQRVYAAARLGLVTFDPTAPNDARLVDSATVPGFLEGPVRALAFDDAGQLWLGGDEGLARWQPGSNIAASCRSAPAGARDADSRVVYLWTGADGELWVGTDGGGDSVRARIGDDAVARLIPDPRAAPGLRGTVSYSTITTDGRIWVATSEGLFRESMPSTREFSVWRADTFDGRPVYAVAEDIDGDLWIGGPLGLFVDDGNNLARVEWWRNEGPPRPGRPPVYGIATDAERVWVAGAAGLAEIDARSNKVTALYSSSEMIVAPGDATTRLTPTIRPWAVVTHDNNRVFAAGEAGVLAIDATTGEFLAATQYGNEGQQYPGSAAVTLAALGDTLYVGDDTGVFVTNPQLDEWRAMDVPYPSPSRASRGIVADKVRNTVWFSTVGGLLQYSMDEARWRHFSSLDGLHSNDFNEGALAIAQDGRVLVGGGDGLSIVDPSLAPPTLLPNPTLLEISVDDQPIDVAAARTSPLAIEPGARRIAFAFGSPDTWIGRDVRVSYRLTGYDQAPRQQRLDQQIVYEGLPPGDYDLAVALSGPLHPANLAQTVSLRVEPHWWQTPLAWLGFAALVIAMGLLTVRWRVTQLTTQERLVAGERDRIARELHDRHLQELVGALMIGRRLQDSVEAPQHSTLAEQMVALLERSSTSARATVRMLLPPDDSRAVTEQIEFHAECASTAFGVPVSVAENGHRFRLADRPRRHTVRIVNEAVINALKHAKADSITVTANWTARRLQITVADNGVGIAADRWNEHDGLGLVNMRQLAKTIGAELSFDSTEDRGTTVVLAVQRPPFWSAAYWSGPTEDELRNDVLAERNP